MYLMVEQIPSYSVLIHSKLGHFIDPLEIKANRLRIKRKKCLETKLFD